MVGVARIASGDDADGTESEWGSDESSALGWLLPELVLHA